jgi:formate-dependent nitrite reductase cytochrome c552 subunit
MAPHSQSDGRRAARTNLLLAGLTGAFALLALAFIGNLWGHPPRRQTIPLVDPKFLEPTPWRRTYADLVKAKEDLSDYDCYGCHERDKPPPIRFDDHQKIIVPKEHSDIVMGHGSHDRNNLCYNCHNEQNLLTLQVRDGRVVKFDEIPLLCGSCHGPTYRDWEAGAHGRTSGYWDRSKGDIQRLVCASCHNPHSPKIPTRQPAPGPHPLRAQLDAPVHAESVH